MVVALCILSAKSVTHAKNKCNAPQKQTRLLRFSLDRKSNSDSARDLIACWSAAAIIGGYLPTHRHTCGCDLNRSWDLLGMVELNHPDRQVIWVMHNLRHTQCMCTTRRDGCYFCLQVLNHLFREQRSDETLVKSEVSKYPIHRTGASCSVR